MGGIHERLVLIFVIQSLGPKTYLTGREPLT